MMYTSTRLHMRLPSNVRAQQTCANDNDINDNDGMLWCVWKIHQKWCKHFVHFSSTSISILNLTMSSESQESDVSNDILSEWKYSQLFTHELNIFLLKQLYQANRFTNVMQWWHHSLFIDCAQMDRRTEKQVKHDLHQFYSVHLADIINYPRNSKNGYDLQYNKLQQYDCCHKPHTLSHKEHTQMYELGQQRGLYPYVQLLDQNSNSTHEYSQPHQW